MTLGRRRGSSWSGAGAAGIGIARLLRLAMLAEAGCRRRPCAAGARAGRLARAGSTIGARISTRRSASCALPAAAFTDYGFTTEFPTLVETVERVRPTVLVGTTGVGGTFTEAVIRAVAAGDARDRSSCRCRTRRRRPRRRRPTSCAGARAGRSSRPGRRSTRSTSTGGGTRSARRTTSSSSRARSRARSRPRRGRSPTGCSSLAARTLAAAVTDERLATGALYPPVDDLRAVSRAIAIAVAREAIEAGVARTSRPTPTSTRSIDAGDVVARVRAVRAGPSGGAPSRGRAVSPRDAPCPRGRAPDRRRGDRDRRPRAGREPRAGEVRVRMLASGVCHSDLHVRDGEWPRPTPIVDGPRGRRRRRGGRAGRDERCGRAAGRAVVARPVRGLPVVPGRPAVGLPRLARRSATGCPMAPPSSADRPTASRSCRTAAIGDDGRGDGRARGGRDRRSPTASTRPSPRSSAAACRPGSGPCSRPPRSRRARRVAVIGLGGVGLSCVMGAVLAGASRIVAIDRVAAKLGRGARRRCDGRPARRRRSRRPRSRRCAT